MFRFFKNNDKKGILFVKKFFKDANSTQKNKNTVIPEQQSKESVFLEKEFLETCMQIQSPPIGSQEQAWQWITGRLAYFQENNLEQGKMMAIEENILINLTENYRFHFGEFMSFRYSHLAIYSTSRRLFDEGNPERALTILEPFVEFSKNHTRANIRSFSNDAEELMYKEINPFDNLLEKSDIDYAAYILLYFKILNGILAQTPFEIDRRENLKKEFLSAFLNISPCNSELWKEYALTIKDEYFYSATIKKALLYYVPAKDGITLGDIYSDMAVHYSYSNIQLASALMAVAKHYGGVSFAAAFVLSKQNVVNMSFGQACEILKAARIQVGLSSLAERALSKINSSSTETPAKHESKECFPENGNENGLQVDLVLCLDCTGGMQYLIDLFIDNALTFVKDVTDSAEAQNNFISQFRVRIVAFRDYVADGNEAMLATDFFNLPEESEIFENVLRCLEAKGGGDDPEDGLEALAYAIRSKWEKNNGNARQIIAVFSDAPTHPLGLGSFSSRYYPKDMAKDFEELTQWWNSNIFISDKEKRLILFTVDGYDWSVISQNWENAVLFPVEGAEGCTELEYEDIVTAISNAI